MLDQTGRPVRVDTGVCWHGYISLWSEIKPPVNENWAIPNMLLEQFCYGHSGGLPWVIENLKDKKASQMWICGCYNGFNV